MADVIRAFLTHFYFNQTFTGVNGSGVITNGVISNGVGGDSDEEMEVN